MKNIKKQKGHSQGCKDFLGIINDDIHNYIVNIISEIKDGFNTEAREAELGEILTSDLGDSYLFFSEYVFKYSVRESESWMQVVIYKVEEYFIIVKYNFEGVWFCKYVGHDLRVAFDFFRQEIEYSQSDFKTILDNHIQSAFGLSENSMSNIDPKNYYLHTGYILPEITESYFEYLKFHNKKFKKVGKASIKF